MSGGLVAAFLWARGHEAGADALAYWVAVRSWLGGTDYYEPPPGVMPYAYAPWTLYLFLPWALLPWDIAWFGWRAVNVVLFAGTVAWAYRSRPLATAILLAILAPALAANLDTGNINILIVVGMWVAQFSGPRLAGLIWALSTGLKWLTAPFLIILRPPARAWGLAFLAIAGVLALATWPQTLHQLDVVVNYPRPVRLDYLLMIWVAVPWLWRQAWPPWWLQGQEVSRRWRERQPLAQWVARFVGWDRSVEPDQRT